jgi:VanZ family protein
MVLVAYLLALVASTHWPSELKSIQASYFDKVIHFLAFAVLAWLVAWALRLDKGGSLQTAAVLVFAIAVFAALDEITQPYVGRQCDPLDWVADLAGATAGISVFSLQSRRSPRP